MLRIVLALLIVVVATWGAFRLVEGRNERRVAAAARHQDLIAQVRQGPWPSFVFLAQQPLEDNARLEDSIQISRDRAARWRQRATSWWGDLWRGHAPSHGIVVMVLIATAVYVAVIWASFNLDYLMFFGISDSTFLGAFYALGVIAVASLIGFAVAAVAGLHGRLPGVASWRRSTRLLVVTGLVAVGVAGALALATIAPERSRNHLGQLVAAANTDYSVALSAVPQDKALVARQKSVFDMYTTQMNKAGQIDQVMATVYPLTELALSALAVMSLEMAAVGGMKLAERRSTRKADRRQARRNRSGRAFVRRITELFIEAGVAPEEIQQLFRRWNEEDEPSGRQALPPGVPETPHPAQGADTPEARPTTEPPQPPISPEPTTEVSNPPLSMRRPQSTDDSLDDPPNNIYDSI